LKALARAAPGTRRDLLLHPSELSHELLDDGSLVIEFTLPAGAYASLIIRNLTRGDPWRGSETPREELRLEDAG
jgi:tRNA(Glu) U13 pseudouridine synthase TruD